jgi:hypothetical protein
MGRQHLRPPVVAGATTGLIAVPYAEELVRCVAAARRRAAAARSRQGSQLNPEDGLGGLPL